MDNQGTEYRCILCDGFLTVEDTLDSATPKKLQNIKIKSLAMDRNR